MVAMTMILTVPQTCPAAISILPDSHLPQQSLADSGTAKTKSTQPSPRADAPPCIDERAEVKLLASEDRMTSEATYDLEFELLELMTLIIYAPMTLWPLNDIICKMTGQRY